MAFWRPFEDFEAEDGVANNNCDEEFKIKDLNDQCQRIILNIFDCLKRENNQECKSFIVKRITKLTKLSFSTISRVIKEGNVNRPFGKKEEEGRKT